MKNYRILRFVLLQLVIISGTLFAQSSNETPVALIKKIIKDVTYKDNDASDWEIARTGTPLKSGEQVKTGKKSLALVLFTDGTGLLRVRENSIMYIYGEKEEDRLNKNTFIRKGLIGFDINKQEAEEFKFTTPTAVAAIRGTAGFLEVGKDSSTTVFCEHGKIEVQSLLGEKGVVFVEGGKVVRINKNGKIKKGNASSGEENKFKKTKKNKLKKILIETEEGTIRLEYYPEID